MREARGVSSYYVTFNDNHNDDRLSEGVSMYGGKLRLRLFVIAVAAMLGTSTQSAVLTIPQSSLVPSSNYYTNTVGGGIGAFKSCQRDGLYSPRPASRTLTPKACLDERL